MLNWQLEIVAKFQSDWTINNLVGQFQSLPIVKMSLPVTTMFAPLTTVSKSRLLLIFPERVENLPSHGCSF